jgi:hypothetical protein
MAAMGGVAVMGVAVVAALNARAERRLLVEEVVRGASQFSDTVKRSTHYAMLQNRWEDAFHIMRTIGAQEGIERVRVFSKEGNILFSTDQAEVRTVVDKQAEACYACHTAREPLERLDLPDRTRIFTGPGGRTLGMITPIYNERGCAGAGCHPPPEAKRVLGVLDIGISLARVDREIAAAQRRAAWVAGGTLLLALGLIGVRTSRPGGVAPVPCVDRRRRSPSYEGRRDAGCYVAPSATANGISRASAAPPAARRITAGWDTSSWTARASATAWIGAKRVGPT